MQRLDHTQGWPGRLGPTVAAVANPRRFRSRGPTAASRRLPSTRLPPPLQAYAANYSGHAKIDRLLFVADRSVGQPLELEALKLAADALKRVGGCCGGLWVLRAGGPGSVSLRCCCWVSGCCF